MANESRVALVITADATGVMQVTTQVNESLQGLGRTTQQLDQQTGLSVARMRQEWLGLAAAAFSALQTIRTGWDLAEQAAAYQEQRASLNALAGQYRVTGDAISDAMRQASGGLLSMAEATRMAGSALLQGLTPTQINELAKGATALSDVTGQKVPEAFEALARAVVTGRERSVEATLGAIDLTAALGAQAEKMSEAEKRAALYAEVVRRLHDLQTRLGEGTASVADQMDRFKVELENVRLIAGEGLIRAFMGVYGTLQLVDAGILQLVAGAATLVSYVGWLTDALRISTGAYKSWGDVAATAWGAQATLTQQGMEKFIGAFTAWEEKAKAFIPPGLSPEAGKAVTDYAKLLEDARKADIASYVAMVNEELRLAGMLAEQELKAQAAIVALKEQQRTDEIAWQVARVEQQLALDEREALRKAELQQQDAALVEAARQADLQSYFAMIDAMIEEDFRHAKLHAQVTQDQFARERTLRAMMVQEAQTSSGLMASAMLQMYQATENKHLAFFKAWKAFKVVETIIATYSSAVKAYDAMASIPYVGPILGAAAAAAAIAFGTAQVATIVSADPGTSSVGSASVPSGGGYAYTPPVDTHRLEPTAEAQRGLSVTVNVYGSIVDHDAFARELVPAIQKAQEDRVR